MVIPIAARPGRAGAATSGASSPPTAPPAVPALLYRVTLDPPARGATRPSAEFAFIPEGGQTRVTWTMSGQNSFFAKAIGLVINCDNMIGKQFEKGLEQLNLVTQAAAKR